MDDRQPEADAGLRHRHDVVHEQIAIHRGDRIHLQRLIVDDDQRRVLGCQQIVCLGIANRSACHVSCLHSASLKQLLKSTLTANDKEDVQTSFQAQPTARDGKDGGVNWLKS